MGRVAKNENGDSSKKKQRVTGPAPPVDAKAKDDPPALPGHKKYIPNWQVYENNSVFQVNTHDIAAELVHGAVLPEDRIYMNSLHPDVVASKLIQGIAQAPALVHKLIEERFESQRNLKSIEAALKVEKNERKRWEHQYKELYSKLHIDGVNADQITIQTKKEETPIKILELEKKLDEKQKNIGVLEERLETTKNLKEKDGLAFNQKLRELNEQVLALEDLNKMLVVKDLESNDKLQEVRKALIKGMCDLKSTNDNIGIKMMGELDVKIFTRGNSEKSSDPNDIGAVEWRILWQKRLNNPKWHPFKITVDEAGNSQELLDKDDSSLQNLKEIWSEEVYNKVTTTLKELIEYNPSGRFPVPELWNFKENRKATLEEVIRYNFTQIKPQTKRRRS